MNFISFEITECVHQQLKQHISVSAVDVDIPPFLACMESAPPPSNQSTLKRRFPCSWRRAPPSNQSTLKRRFPCSWRRAPPSNQSTLKRRFPRLAPRSTQQPKYSLNGTIFMSHGCCIHSSHYGRVCPSFLSSHVYDRANKRVLSPRSTHELPSRCPSVHPFFLPSFLPSFAGI